MKKEVCALVVTYNRCNLLKECINAINKQQYECDLFVVNNNSTDDTNTFLIENKINHFTTDKNIGGSGGFNLGIKEILNYDYKYIWLMDDDCIPCEDALKKLMAAAKKLNYQFGFLASKCLWIDGSIHKMNAIHSKELIYKNIYKTKQATFVSLLIKSEIVKNVGLPIKDFFIWGDDIEYTRRIAVKNNIDSYYVDNSSVIHKTSNNNGSKIAFDDFNNMNKYVLAYRNESFLYRQEGFKGVLYYYSKCLYNFIRIIVLSKDNKLLRVKTLLKGMTEGLKFNPEIELYD